MTITRKETSDKITTYSYYAASTSDSAEKEHTLLDSISFADLEKSTGFTFQKDTRFYPCGWQSWDAGWEIQFGQKQPVYNKMIIPQFQKYIEVPETKIKKSKSLLIGQFIIYFRNGSSYLVLASTGAFKKLPPVQYAIDLKKKKILIYAYANGKMWQKNEAAGEIKVFKTNSYKELKETISEIYKTDRFDYQNHLTKMPGGYESWYNHYNNIDEKIILDDLSYLNKTDNIINKFIIQNKTPCIFQIDDGWQTGTGEWEINKERFPQGLSPITKQIEELNYIPGLWIAPFICDFRLPFVQKHLDWILKDYNGNYVEAGYNPAWGGKKGNLQPGKSGSYYAWDISNPEVLEYIDSLMEKLINQWGFRYIKLDFLFAGLLWGKYKTSGAAYEHYEKAISLITKRKINKYGLPVFYLGCGMSFECSFIHLPLSRIGTDTLEKWDRLDLKMLNYPARPSAYINMKDTLSHAFWNNSVFQNDPDVIFVRNENCSLKEDEKLLIAFINFAFGSQLMYSDDPKSFCQNEIPLTNKIAQMYDKFKGMDWSVEETKNDVYKAVTADGNYSATLDLKRHKIFFS